MEDNIEEKNKIEDNKKGVELSPEELKKKVEDYNPPAAHTPPLVNELNKLEMELKECQKLANNYLAGWQRSRADFLNYKKEEMERMEDILKFSNTELILKLLPILDNFEKAEKEIPDDKQNDKFLEGILQIKKQLQDFLKSQGVEDIKSTIGEKFDPNFHEVVEDVEAKDKPAFAEASAGKESGIVIEEIQKGYLLHGKLIRPAKVKISK